MLESADRWAAADCAADRAFSLALGLAQGQGKVLFGEGFSLTHRMSWSPFGEGLAGDVDMVVPLASPAAALGFAQGGAAGAGNSAFFVQQGVTRWSDGHGFRRNDARYGAAWRFALSEADALGVSALMQENLERGHRRLVTGVDYEGRWGRGWAQHLLPTTGWQPGRTGYLERAVGGTRLGFGLDATSTLSLEASLSRWRDGGGGKPALDGRLGAAWKPHPWLALRAGWGGIGPAEDTGSLQLTLSVPFGSGARGLPAWQGLGVAGGAAQGAPDLWRPIENVDRIQTVERVRPVEDLVASGAVAARFTQETFATGSRIVLEVSFPEAVAGDVRLIARLVPGSGGNPAVAGVDYVDQPYEITVRDGTATGQVEVQLLFNPDIEEAGRTLSVEARLAS